MTEHVDERCENPLCFSCNPEDRPRCGPCRRVMLVVDGWGFRCPECGSGVTMAGAVT